MNPLMRVKAWLTTVPESSLRFQLVAGGECDNNETFPFAVKTIREARVCQFYLLLLPGACLGWLFMGIATIILSVGGYLVGYTPTWVEDGGKEYEGSEMFYPYKYSPLRQTYKKWTPGQIIAPFIAIAVIIYIFATGVVGIWLVGLVKFYYQHAEVIVKVAIGGAAFAAVVYLYSRYQYEISDAWRRKCPRIEVIGSESDPK